MNHPKNRADRRTINQKKRKKHTMERGVYVSEDNVNSFIETGLSAMRLINPEETVVKTDREFNTDTQVYEFLITLKKEVSEVN